VTIKQGAEAEIKRSVPAIVRLLDVTDHAGATITTARPGAAGWTEIRRLNLRPGPSARASAC
jgi:hypothetical protein